MSVWSEDYRPTSLKDCILSSSANSLHELVAKGEIPNLLFYGPPGNGKTTAAKAICNDLGYDSLLINASDDSGIEILRTTIKSYATSMSFDGKKKCVILDEVDGTSAKFQEALRGVINDVHSNCVFILTCNNRNKLHKAIWSRCSNYEFNIPKKEIPKLAGQLFKRVMFILKEEGIEVESEKAVGQVIRTFFPDIRRVINELQKYSGRGVIDIGILEQIKEIDINELVGHLKEKQFTRMCQWVKDNVEDPDQLFDALYKKINGLVTPQSIPELILILNEGQYKQAFVANPELNIVAVLVEVMMNQGVTWK